MEVLENAFQDIISPATHRTVPVSLALRDHGKPLESSLLQPVNDTADFSRKEHLRTGTKNV